LADLRLLTYNDGKRVPPSGSDIGVLEAALRLGEVSKPSNVADKGFVYCKDVSDATELFYEDAAANEIQISTGGRLNLTGNSIEDLSDVNTMSPSDGQVLTWDNGNSRWDAATPSAGGDSVNFETLAATKTLTGSDAKFQILDPDGAHRTVNLPYSSVDQGKIFVIRNVGEVGATQYYLQIQVNAESFDYLYPGAVGWYVYDTGNVWRSLAPWNNEPTGYIGDPDRANSVTLGPQAQCRDNDGVAIGQNADAQEPNAIAIGTNTQADQDAIAIGRSANAAGNNTISIGFGSSTTTDGNQTVVGNNADTTQRYASAFGDSAQAGKESTAVGYDATATGATASGCVAVGRSASALTPSSVAVGMSSSASSYGAAVGFGAQADNNGTALGYAAFGEYYSVAIGRSADCNSGLSTTRRVAIGAGNGVATSSASTKAATVSSAGDYGIAVGGDAYVSADYGIAIGYQAKANHAGAVVIGRCGTNGASNLSSAMTDAVHVNKLHVEVEAVMKEVAAPSNISSKGQLYVDTSGELHFIDGSGNDVQLTNGGSPA